MRSSVSSKCVSSLQSDDNRRSHVHFQAELATSAGINIPDADYDVSDPHAAVSEVRNEHVDPHTTASDVDHDASKNSEDEDDPNQAVRTTRTLPVAE